MTEIIDNSDNMRIKWHRTKIDREVLKSLNERRDAKGFIQAGGHLALVILLGGLAIGSVGRLPWYVTVLLIWLEGTCHCFLLNGFHELIHGTVFKTKALNTFFLNIYSFLFHANPIHFWASHTEHHKYTLHPPKDLEVVLPVPLTLRGFLSTVSINPWGFRNVYKLHKRHSRGILEGEWEHKLFPDSEPKKKKDLIRWARIILYGQGSILCLSLLMALLFRSPNWLIVPFVTTFAPYIGGGLNYLLNNTQHVGLTDSVPDFRLCCRTIRVNPFFEFLYWNMNYHIEHHMYAGVPCYNLKKMHRAISHELPYTPTGLYETWKQIMDIVQRQKTEKDYQFIPVVSKPVNNEK